MRFNTRQPTTISRNLSNVLVIGFLLVTCGCSTFSFLKSSVQSPKHELTLKQSANVSELGNPPEKKQKGEVVIVQEKPVMIEAPGYVGVLVMPSNPEYVQKSELNLRPVSLWAGKGFDRELNENMDEIIYEIHNILFDLASQRGKEALGRVENLQLRYPQVSALAFLKVSCLLVLNERNQAAALLENTLSRYPDSRIGQEMYLSVFGKAYVPRKPASQVEPLDTEPAVSLQVEKEPKE